MMEFITSPNQRQVIIQKVDQPSGYTKIDTRSLKEALGKLSYSAFMLYMYFCANATGFRMILSPQVICRETAFTRNTYYDAFRELVQKEYLVAKPGSQTHFVFYETPSLRGEREDNPKNRTVRPENGKAHTEKQESMYQKTSENIKNTQNTQFQVRAGARDLEYDRSSSGMQSRQASSDTEEDGASFFLDL